MDYFLHYFEKTNPDTDWSDFTSITPSVPKTFSGFSSVAKGLFIRENKIVFESVKHPSYIISDGTSSDEIFSLENKKPHREIFLNFLNERNNINSKIPMFFLQSIKSTKLGSNVIPAEFKVKKLKFSELKKIKELDHDTIYQLEG